MVWLSQGGLSLSLNVRQIQISLFVPLGYRLTRESQGALSLPVNISFVFRCLLPRIPDAAPLGRIGARDYDGRESFAAFVVIGSSGDLKATLGQEAGETFHIGKRSPTSRYSE